MLYRLQVSAWLRPLADLVLVPEAEKLALPKGGRKGMTEAEEKIFIIISRPAMKILGVDAERFKVLLETVCREMGFKTAYVSKSWGSVEVLFLGRREAEKDEG